MKVIAEYIWIDGVEPTSKVRSKTKILEVDAESEVDSSCFPLWQFDGSSTAQAEGDSSDCLLQPVRVYPDPMRRGHAYLVLCEVFTVDGAHSSNKRARLRSLLDAGASEQDCKFGFEQEYTLYKGSRPLGFPSERRYPEAQGPYYCGVGADEVYGRDLVEAHLTACMFAGISIQGINAEVMPGQWEFQIGGPDVDVLTAADDLWVSRWLLYRLGEEFGVSATLDPKPIPGEWNGAGMHTNFSTEDMRKEGGISAIEDAVSKMALRIDEHLAAYGAGYESRLTGRHETCRYDEFKWGVSDRTASIRIPANVHAERCGYLEDRRPNANADPYDVAAVLIETVCA